MYDLNIYAHIRPNFSHVSQHNSLSIVPLLCALFSVCTQHTNILFITRANRCNDGNEMGRVIAVVALIGSGIDIIVCGHVIVGNRHTL